MKIPGAGEIYGCGWSEFTAWHEGKERLTRWLGPFDSAMTLEEISQRLEMEKLTQQGQEGWKRGWMDARKAAGL
jgi:hypothetical protein